jgi:hypothetical protein
MREPMIAWARDMENDAFYCRVVVPDKWLTEVSHIKRRLLLWWWLTQLAWSLPK